MAKRAGRLLDRWIRLVLRHPVLVVAAFFLLAAASLGWAATHLGVDTDTEDMLSPKLAFRQEEIRFQEAFPDTRPGLLLVVDAATPEAAREAAGDLEELLRGDSLMRWTYLPGSEAFFREKALLYRPAEALEAAARRLAPRGAREAPSLGDVARKPGLPTLFRFLERAVADEGTEPLRTTWEELTRGMGSALQGGDYRASWERILAGGGALDRRQVVQVDPVADYASLLPVGRAMERIRAAAWNVELAHAPRVSVRITGSAALEHEELAGVLRGAALASLFSLALVTGTLLLGLRSGGLVLATALSLVVGLALTGAFAALAVGKLNMISLAFAVLYIGLGVDYAIHLVLRYRELLGDGRVKPDAIREAVVEVGPSLGLCALTTAFAFYAFLPTTFRGVAELGLISGTAMFLALGVTLSFLPALLLLIPAPEALALRAGAGDHGIPFGRDRLIRWAAAGLGLASLLLLPAARFDYNPNNLRDPASESVATFRDLLAAEGASPWSLAYLAADSADASRTSDSLERLSTVSRVAGPESFLPDDADRKRVLLGRLADLLEPEERAPGAADPRPDRHETTLALLGLLDRIEAPGARSAVGTDPAIVGFLALARHLAVGLQLGGPEQSEKILQSMTAGAFDDLADTRERLRTLADAAPLTVADLPPEIRRRWLGRNGERRLEVLPAEDLGREEALRRFVAEVRSVTPRVTGLPVVYLEAADAVVGAFRTAFAGALAAIVLLLAVTLPSVRDVGYVLVPLLLAGAATGAAGVALGIPFNFANVIVLPLLFGLGVDNGIHLVSRVKRLPEGKGVLATSTSRAVVLSGLTTLFSFSSLAFTAHRGVASMGKLLVVGVGLILLSTLVVLPAFLARRLEGRAPPA